MNNDYIAVLDSGIGGISVLNELLKLMPNQNFIYFGDNKNAPYGSKNLKTLLELTKSNLDYLTSSFNLKGLVLGCNTLSVNFLSQIQDYSGLKTFGVFPPVESAILKGKTLLLATERTAERYSGVKNLFAVGLKDLAGEIEKNAFCLENVCFERHLKSLGLPKNFLRDFETLILGCTHYNFIKNKILESVRSVLPIALIVVALSFTLVPLTAENMLLFLMGVVCLIFGMSLFTAGAEMSMQPLGAKIGTSIHLSRS